MRIAILVVIYLCVGLVILFGIQPPDNRFDRLGVFFTVLLLWPIVIIIGFYQILKFTFRNWLK